MVTLHFRLSDTGTVMLDSPEPETLQTLLDRCAEKTGTDIGEVIAIRGGKVLPVREIVYDADVIDIFPAISGG